MADERNQWTAGITPPNVVRPPDAAPAPAPSEEGIVVCLRRYDPVLRQMVFEPLPDAPAPSETDVEALVSELADAEFWCGEWDREDDEPYEALSKRASEAREKLIAALRAERDQRTALEEALDAAADAMYRARLELHDDDLYEAAEDAILILRKATAAIDNRVGGIAHAARRSGA